MTQDSPLLDIHLALKELQITQKTILEKVLEIKVDHKELTDRVDTIDSNMTLIKGFFIPVTFAFYFAVDWIKSKMGIV